MTDNIVELRTSAEDPRVPLNSENFLSFFGIQPHNLPAVTVESALTVPAVAAAVNFLPGSLANLPLHAYRTKGDTPERIKGGVQRLLNEAPNEEWTSFGWRKYLWQQVFTVGRGLSWVERINGNVVGIWPMDPVATVVARVGGRRVYRFGGREYPAADVIEVPFMLRRDQLAVFSPIMLAAKAIQLAIAMGDYASGFFAGGGVPPLALVGPMPAGAEAVKRAQADIDRAVKSAKKNSEAVFPIPPGYELKPVGFEPDKGQMTEARLFQVSEIGRVYNLPPVFLQDLSSGTFSNTEQQDLHLVKHTIAQWARAFEEELNLKLFGKSSARFVQHNLDALMRGDFKSRIDALARGVQTALYTPDEARELEGRPPVPNGNLAYMQGATVPLGTAPVIKNGGVNDPGTTGADQPT